MNKWLILGAAIVAETIATAALKSSEGFTKLIPSVVVIIGYGIAFYFSFNNLTLDSSRYCLCNLVRRRNCSDYYYWLGIFVKN